MFEVWTTKTLRMDLLSKILALTSRARLDTAHHPALESRWQGAMNLGGIRPTLLIVT